MASAATGGNRAPLASAAPPETLVEYVTEQIRTRVVLGRLEPGQRIPLYGLAEEFGVSRVPLREAVRQLEAEGLVENLPRRGTIVSRLNRRDLQDAFRVLDVVELIAARRAVRAADAPVVTRMRDAAERMQALADHRVSEEMLAAHRDFHFTFFDAAGQGILLHHLKMLWHTCERYVMYGMPNPDRQESSRAEHLELLACIEAGDATAATRVLQRHLKASLQFALSNLPDDATGS